MDLFPHNLLLLIDYYYFELVIRIRKSRTLGWLNKVRKEGKQKLPEEAPCMFPSRNYDRYLIRLVVCHASKKEGFFSPFLRSLHCMIRTSTETICIVREKKRHLHPSLTFAHLLLCSHVPVHSLAIVFITALLYTAAVISFVQCHNADSNFGKTPPRLVYFFHENVKEHEG